MDKMTFENAVNSKAKELGIKPKLLLFAIGFLTENPEAKEGDVFKPYFQCICSDMSESAIIQQRNPRKGMKEAGELAFHPIKEKKKGLFTDYTELEKARVKELLGSGEEIMLLHMMALRELMKDQLIINKAAKRAGYNGKYLDAIQQIKFLCPELLDQGKRVRNLLSSLNLN